MSSSREALRSLGAAIRAARLEAGLTQGALGRRAGIVGKYVSEIERGTRDIPFSTLRAIVQDGLGLRLEVGFRKSGHDAPLTNGVDEVARSIAELPADQRKHVLAIVRAIVELVR